MRETGETNEGLTAGQQAVDIYRGLAETHPDRYLAYLARSLTNPSIRLGEVGRDDEAAAARDEADRLG